MTFIEVIIIAAICLGYELLKEYKKNWSKE